MATIITKTINNVIDWIGSKAEVLAVKAWSPATFYQLDLHLPATDMARWTSIHRMKCRVAQFEFRDYSPTQWDAINRTCRLYIEAGHNGAGSEWVRRLRAHDTVSYTTSPTQAVPAKPGKMLCLGDGSALGHFLALKQLTSRPQYSIEAAVFLHGNYELPPSLRNDNPEVDFLIESTHNATDVLSQWLTQKSLTSYSSIYLNGSIPMVQQLRKTIKSKPDIQAKLFVQGFWQ